MLRRLLIAGMACVLAWQLQRAEGEENARAQHRVSRLSGRQQKRGRMESIPALLAGLSVLLNTLTLLSEYTPEELTRLATTVPGPFEDVWIPVPSRPGTVKMSKTRYPVKRSIAPLK
ncbi:TPA: hypothetical protein ACP61A_004340 [Escherichia coli]|uniref:hypothetical protein n=1 Tax=Escherichia coli TaxID=562 RepID=UPI0021BE9B30|nr:hypothetical protein [Escherichia coli]